MVKVLLAGTLCTAAFGGTIVIPPSQASTPGNATELGPGVAGSGIYQELIGPTFPGPIAITGITFRAAPGTGAFDLTFDALNVFVSTSPNFPNTIGGGAGMSSTFADNVGPDNTLVFSGTNLTWSAPGCASGACPFNISIPFDAPFLFNPKASGGLLVELVFTNLNDVNGSFDAQSYNSPGLFLGQVLSTGGTSATSGTFAYQGNIVQITETLVPEPANWGMTAGAAALLVIWRKLRPRKRVC